MNGTALRAALARRPRVRLANLPTPLERAPRLERALGLAALHIKRDDLTGLALGGNKARQMEYLLGDAVAQGASAIVTGAGVESNHLRTVSAACARLGLRACLVFRGERPPRPEGNLLLDGLLGAECRFLPGDRFYSDFPSVAAAWCEELRAAGETPYLVDTLGWDSPSLGLAALGYVDGALEIAEQAERDGVGIDRLYVCSGAATQAGLALAKTLLGLPWEIVGVSASPFIPDKPAVIAQVAARAARLLGLDAAPSAAEITNLDQYIGPGYGLATPSSTEALRMAARTEGLLLDPTYTAKAMGALIDQRRRGVIAAGARVVFLHTGGAPNLFLERNVSAGG
ncbi:MAG: pyridoxal-phosphate dependent enzyme [Chloroflexi bacterium]|nr:pyridoxal-phosphate dependent enzyme [Chloroflexota bacterium]